MTLRELAEKKICYFARAGWGPGEYVHFESLMAHRDGQTVVGYNACFCHAPIPGDHPDCEDDMWMPYEGADVQQPMISGPLPASLMGLPQPLLEILSMIASLPDDDEEEARAEVQEQVPEVPPWSVGPTMRA